MFYRTTSLSLFIIAIFSCIAVFLSSPAFAAPQVVHTLFPTSDIVIASVVVTDPPFNASPDGVTDCAGAIQSAIDSVAKSGGGVVFLPAGRYRCTGSIVLREGVTLRGDWKAPDLAKGSYAVQGAILMPTAGRGNADGAPFISMQRGSGVRDLSIWYPDQTADHIIAYPWTLATDETHSGNNFTIYQVTLVNPYQAMKFGPEFNEMFTVREVYGTPLKTGLWADSVTDIGRIIDLHFSARYWLKSGLPYSTDSFQIVNYLRDNGTGIEMLRSDWQYVYDVDLEGYQYGFHFCKGAHGETLGVIYRANVSGGQIGLLCDEAPTNLLVTSSRFDGSDCAVCALDGCGLGLSDCKLGGDTKQTISFDGGSSLRMQNCELISKGDAPAIDAKSGYLSLIGCTLNGKGPFARIGAKTRRALFLDCRAGNRGLSLLSTNALPPNPANIHAYKNDPAAIERSGILSTQAIKNTPSNSEAKILIENNCRGDIQIDNRSLQSLRPSIPPIVLPPDPRPSTDLLFNVVDYGAQAGGWAAKAFDNTHAFQSALDAAGAKGGGTVYVPAGLYRFNGNLIVPSGVELRGCFDVPHHSISMGSVLLPFAGRDYENGAPFISLMSGSGARGLTIWYPEQKVDSIAPYPWTVRAMGPKCWLMDFTSANSYRLADFGSYPSDGHLLRYVAGSPLKTGIWVSKGSGVVDSCHFNMHEWLRKTDTLPSLTDTPGVNAGDLVFDYQTRNLDAFVFGNCPHEIQVNNFVYGCAKGLEFVSDHGKGASGVAINHATDGSSTGVSIESCAPEGLQLVNTEIATVGKHKHAGLEIGAKCAGPVSIFEGVSFGEHDTPSLVLHGVGLTTVQGWKTTQLEARISGGDAVLQGLFSMQPLSKYAVIDGDLRSLNLDGNMTGSDLAFGFDKGPNVNARTNALDIAPTPLADRFNSNSTDAHSPHIQPIGISHVNDAHCALKPGAGPLGRAAFVLSGTGDAGTHAIAYYAIYDVDLPVLPDTVLRYMICPGNLQGERTGIDLIFDDGSTMRDMGFQDTYGSGMHPGAEKGIAGAWTKIECAIGKKAAGKTIRRILFAYDQGNPDAPFTSSASSIEIGEPAPR
jgi:hypothetical protein